LKKFTRFSLFSLYLVISIAFSASSYFFIFLANYLELLNDWTFYVMLIFYLLSLEELYRWAKNGKRSEMSDFVAILFFFFLIFFFSKDILTSVMGAFSIYLWFGIFELKDYPVLNKILIKIYHS